MIIVPQRKLITRRKLLIGGAASLIASPAIARFPLRGTSVPPASGSLLKINLSFDASWSGAPSFYTTDLNTAVSIITAAFPNTNITLTIQCGYTELEGGALGSVGPGSSGGSDIWVQGYSFSSLKTTMAGLANPPAEFTAMLNNLPAGSSLGGVSIFNVGWAAAKIFGLFGAGPQSPSGPNDTSQFDGAIGVGSGWNHTKTVSMFLHEIGHATGRDPQDAPYVFSHLTAPGVWDVTGTNANGYFSLDGGTTNLAFFDNSGSDPTDFRNSVTDPSSGLTDAYDAQQVNPLQNLSPLDIQFMRAQGFK